MATAVRARLILDQFALATGLVINFTKSTMVPMHCGADLVEDMQKALGCRVEGFPQIYLGLPLTCDKLKMAHFVPLIAKVDKYLSGWCSLLLSTGGRLVLLNAVLDALPAYAMGALALPPALLKAINALRRAFLWNVEGRASGAKCLVAWTSVCRPKEDGGLGIKSLSDRNACVQVKLLHRLHSGAESPWAAWAWKQINGPVAAGKRTEAGAHWAALVELMPLYRSISKPIVGDGQRTSFWDDDWLGIGALRHTAPALFSHATKPQASFAAVLGRGVRESLVTRLTVEAENELSHVMRLRRPRLPLARQMLQEGWRSGCRRSLRSAVDRRGHGPVRQLCLGEFCSI